MPIYEYHCKSCGHQFDALRSFIDADKPITCENCGKETTFRVISSFFVPGQASSAKSGGGTCSGCSGGSCSSCAH